MRTTHSPDVGRVADGVDHGQDDGSLDGRSDRAAGDPG